MKYLKCNTIQYNEIKLIKHTARIPCSLRIQPPPMFDLFRRNFPPSVSDVWRLYSQARIPPVPSEVL